MYQFQGQKGVSLAAKKRRNAFKDAFKTIHKRAVWSGDDGVEMVEVTFGTDALAVATSTAVCLEQELSDVTDEDEGLLIVSDVIAGTYVGK